MDWIRVTIAGSGRESIYRIEDIDFVKESLNENASSEIYFRDGSHVSVTQSIAVIFSVLERS